MSAIARLRSLKAGYLEQVNVRSDNRRYTIVFVTFAVPLFIAFLFGNIGFWTLVGTSVFATYITRLLDKNVRVADKPAGDR